jgi:hypothetical protein
MHIHSMDFDTFKQLVKQHVTASASTQHHMIQPVQLMLRGDQAHRTVEEAFRRMDVWLEKLAGYEPTTRRSYMTGMRDILRVRQIADTLSLDAAERAGFEERLGVLLKETSAQISSKAAAAPPDDEKAALRLRVQLLEHALDIIAGVIRSSTGSA